MYSPGWISNVNKSEVLPPLHVKKKVRESDKWKRAVLDSFEHIALEQFQENLRFYDYYRMVDGKISYQELSDAIPHLENMENLLDGVGIPTFLKHYDILGIIVNALVGKFVDMQDKFHVVDTSEVAQNEFLRRKNKEIQDAIKKAIELEVNTYMAEMGFDPQGQKFSSPEEQQQFLQQMEQMRNSLIPKDTERTSKSTYKNIGMVWGESTLERDRERFNFNRLNKNEFRDYLLSGRCFREHKMYGDRYGCKTWSPKNTFHSKEIETGLVQEGEYVGRLHFYTPAEVIKEYGRYMSPDKQKELLGGNENWKTFIGDGVLSGTITQAIQSNFNKPVTTPFNNYHDYNFYLGLQDYLGIPMGNEVRFHKDGTQSVADRYLPRFMDDSHGRYSIFANVLRDDIINREDLCQVTEVYFRGYYLHGYLTIENENGRLETIEVTEDILPELLKEKGIKQTYKESFHDMIDNFEKDTLKWQWRPMIYEGVKIQSGNLSEAMYLYCRPTDLQIQGESEIDLLLPVSGFIGKGIAQKIEPYQVQYNFCMNQIYSLLEKELGMFFLLDVALIPSEYADWGNAEEALIHLRNIAKETGILPVETSGDSQKNANQFNQFSTYNISYTAEINSRVQLAEFFQRKAYEVIGINPNILSAPTKYETSEGVRISNENSFAQVSELFEDFNLYLKSTLELHLSCAQFAQSNSMDISLFYTKSDGSIEYLRQTDPEFPLRRLGLVVTTDSRKRKELETFKQYLLNTNTIGSDTLELAKLIGSDSMSEIIEIAKREREYREDQMNDQQRRQQELLEQQARNKEAEQMREFELDEMSNQRDRENNIERERIKAIGRAADKQSDPQAFREIEKEADEAKMSLKQQEMSNKMNIEATKIKQKEVDNQSKRDLKLEELKLRAKELEEKIKSRKSNEYIAQINKN